MIHGIIDIICKNKYDTPRIQNIVRDISNKRIAISNDDGTWHHYDTAWHNIDAKVLSAIYLFAKEMPLLFTAPLISIGKIARKRKRDNTTML